MSQLISRERLMSKLAKAYPKMFLKTTEEFDGSEGGIWTSGEESPEDRNGLPIFSYYAESGSYEFGVVKHLVRFLERNGWYAEWYDAGTMMIWEE